MPQKQFRKLRMYLPRQPLVNQRPWLMAGILLVMIFLLIAIYCYITATHNAPLQQPAVMK
jgi:heme/copper-type cytochrome/quinol oxidase subunit 3